MALDHPDARPHETGELEHGHTSGECVRGEGRAEVVDPRRSLDARRLNRGRPLAPPEVVEIEEPATRRREQDRRINPRRERLVCRERPTRERDLSAALARLGELDDLAVRERPSRWRSFASPRRLARVMLRST
jgi:hypothetical protein